jgi:hypothetical protein
MLTSLALAALPLLSQTPARPALDELPALLRARATRAHDESSGHAASLGPIPSGSLLFTMDGPDNAECVRSVPDVNGDGRDEIIATFDESGQPNVFCLDGASSGTASVVWSLQTSDGASGGSCWGDQSVVPCSDTDGNGFANVLVGTAWGGRTAYDFDALAGATTWKYDTYLGTASGWIYSLCEIGDVTGDGVPEYAFGSGSDGDSAYRVAGASPGPQATLLWQFPAGDAVYSVRNFGDANGDGEDDVLIAVGDNIDKLFCLEGDSALPGGTVLWSYEPGPTVYACGVLPDITGDGVNEALAVLWTTLGSAVRCRNGATGLFIWNSSSLPDYGMQVQIIEDVNGDGYSDIVVSSWENAVSVLSGLTGAQIWKTFVGTLNGGDVWSARPIPDVTGDGLQDVVAASFDTNVYVMDGVTGAIQWAYPTGNRVMSVAPVGDLDGDGFPEIVAGTQNTTSSTLVYVLEGEALDPFPSFCDGADGSLASCPCANPGAPESGCDIAQATGGVELTVVSQQTSPTNQAVLMGAGYPPASAPTAIVIRAPGLDPASPVAFGDGLRCVSVPLVRLGAATAGGGTSTHTFGHATTPGTYYYQLWFRNTPASYCTPAAYNLSNGRVLSW